MSREIQQSNKAPRHHNDNFESDKRFIETVAELRLINNTIKVEAIIDTNKLDFNNHTYLFVFGAPIKKMYYSFKTTLFDDKSPSYAKAIRHKKKCVFINYNIPTGYTYLYEIKKDETLTGFNGI